MWLLVFSESDDDSVGSSAGVGKAWIIVSSEDEGNIEKVTNVLNVSIISCINLKCNFIIID